MPDFTKLSAAKLQAAYDRASNNVSLINKALIAAGRGNERCNDTLQMTDELSLKYRAASDVFFAIVDEKNARKRWHGSLAPIRRKA